MSGKAAAIRIIKDEAIVRQNVYSSEEVESLDGLGEIVETIEPLLTPDETMEVDVYYE